jgi:hypothetical protein
MILTEEVKPDANDDQVKEEEKLSEEEVLFIIKELDEKFSEIQREIILAKFGDDNKPGKEIVQKVLKFIAILSDAAEKSELEKNYLDLATKYVFLAKFIQELTEEEIPSFPV